MEDPDFDFLNPPLAPQDGDVIFGVIAWALIMFGVGALWVWLT